jgi:hypothetical protein
LRVPQKLAGQCQQQLFKGRHIKYSQAFEIPSNTLKKSEIPSKAEIPSKKLKYPQPIKCHFFGL